LLGGLQGLCFGRKRICGKLSIEISAGEQSGGASGSNIFREAATHEQALFFSCRLPGFTTLIALTVGTQYPHVDHRFLLW